MLSILQQLTGQLPTEIKQAEHAAKKRRAWKNNPKWNDTRNQRMRERYAGDPALRDQLLSKKRTAWDATPQEKRDALYQQKKNRIAAMTAEEYERECARNRAACKRYREMKSKSGGASNAR